MKSSDLKSFESLYPSSTREAEIEKLLSIIRSGRSAQIVGIPGSGKGIFMRLLAYNKDVRIKHLGQDQERVHFVLMDFSEMKNRALFEVIKFMLISLSYSLGERGFSSLQNEVNKTLKDALSFHDELILFQALKRCVDFLSVEKKLTLIFLFDRFSEYIPGIDERFFANLKILRNRAKYRFAAVFSMTRPLEEILDAPLISEFYEFIAGNIIYLHYCDPVGLNFRLSYIERVTKTKLSSPDKEKMIALTAGHGKLARICIEALLSQKIEDVEKFLLSKNEVKGALFEIWSALSPFEQKLVLQGKENEYLLLSNLVKNGKITIPLLLSFIKTLPADAHEKIVFDANSRQIKRGADDISDILSSSEFRLLSYLLANENRVCEKEEIINAVWKDTATKEGVTDQALDQIIYRVRRKIENDPNNPSYVLTVKGRGYKLANG